MLSYHFIILPIIMKGQDSRPRNGSQKNTQLEITGKYHQSQSSQRSWSRRQYVPNYVSGANNTPLGSPARMSPVDSSGVDSSANAAKAEREVGKKRDSEVVVEVRATTVIYVPTTTTNTTLCRHSRRTRRNQNLKRKKGTALLTRQMKKRLPSCQNYPKNRHL